MNASSTSAGGRAPEPPAETGKSQVVALVVAWTAVGLPLAWGVVETLRKTLALFQ